MVAVPLLAAPEPTEPVTLESAPPLMLSVPVPPSEPTARALRLVQVPLVIVAVP